MKEGAEECEVAEVEKEVVPPLRLEVGHTGVEEYRDDKGVPQPERTRKRADEVLTYADVQDADGEGDLIEELGVVWLAALLPKVVPHSLGLVAGHISPEPPLHP